MTDSELTKERILSAAKDEFAAVGFAGARVDTIARLAGCNKQLIYHYFSDKQGLYEAVMERELTHKPPISLHNHDIMDHFETVFEDIPKRRQWLRLMMWESLANEDRPVVGEALRKKKLDLIAKDVENAQSCGLIPKEIQVRFLMIAFMGFIMFPWIMPQMVRIATGLNPSDPAFRKQYLATLYQIFSGVLRRPDQPSS